MTSARRRGESSDLMARRSATPQWQEDAPREGKRQRLATKQDKYAVAARRFPEVAGGQTGATLREELEMAKLRYESVTDGVPPTRALPQRADQGCRPAPLRLTDLEVTRVLGKGGSGMVLAAKVRRRLRPHALDVEGAQVAVKAVHKRSFREMEPEDGTYLEENPFYDEKNTERANLHALPWHPFVAGAYDCLADTRNLYVLQEAALGPTLGQLVRARGALPAAVCRFFFANVVLALEHVGRAGLVHGDLKPDNLFLGADGFLLLGDFGLATRWDEPAAHDALGTLPYMSPELAQGRGGEEARVALDWWSLGCVLFEMATGRMAFPTKKGAAAHGGDTGARDEELQKRVMRGQYCWPAGVAVDAQLKDLVTRMLRYDLHARCGPQLADVATGVVPAYRQVRAHPFVHGFPWQSMADRTLVAPIVRKAEPDTAKGWHHRRLPPQAKIPGIPCQVPPGHLDYDNRFESRKEAAWRAREKQRHEQARREMLAEDERLRRQAMEEEQQEETLEQVVERLAFEAAVEVVVDGFLERKQRHERAQAGLGPSKAAEEARAVEHAVEEAADQYLDHRHRHEIEQWVLGLAEAAAEGQVDEEGVEEAADWYADQKQRHETGEEVPGLFNEAEAERQVDEEAADRKQQRAREEEMLGPSEEGEAERPPNVGTAEAVAHWYSGQKQHHEREEVPRPSTVASERQADKEAVEDTVVGRRQEHKRVEGPRPSEDDIQQTPPRRSPRIAKGKGRAVQQGSPEEIQQTPPRRSPRIAKGKQGKVRQEQRLVDAINIAQAGEKQTKDPRAKGKQRESLKSNDRTDGKGTGRDEKEGSAQPRPVFSLPP